MVKKKSEENAIQDELRHWENQVSNHGISRFSLSQFTEQHKQVVDDQNAVVRKLDALKQTDKKEYDDKLNDAQDALHQYR